MVVFLKQLKYLVGLLVLYLVLLALLLFPRDTDFQGTWFSLDSNNKIAPITLSATEKVELTNKFDSLLEQSQNFNAVKFKVRQSERELNLRYWELRDLLKNNRARSTAVYNKNSTDGVNLWNAHGKGGAIFGDDVDDRIVAQLVWEMETGNDPEIIANLKEKFILILDQSWQQNFKHASLSGSCPPKSIYASKCKIIWDIPANISTLSAIVGTPNSGDPELPDSAAVLRIPYFKHTLESPYHSDMRLEPPNRHLATFWRHSEIVTPYAKWVYYDPAVRFKEQSTNYSAGKTKMAAIFLSNCLDKNGRLKYIKQLQKYVDVDIYGSCGPLKCPISNSKKCFQMLRQDYHFYLAFENSNCRDYITEKFFHTGLRYNAIPIVMGAHPDDYRSVAPQNSYIHIQDFQSPKELAKYMTFLTVNSTAYNKYFEWQQTGAFIEVSSLCRLCALLFYHDRVPLPERQAFLKWNWNMLDGNNDQMCAQGQFWKLS